MEGFDWIEILRDKGERAAEDLKELAGRTNAEQLFVAAMLQMCVVPASEMSEAKHGTVPVTAEALAFHLYPMFGSSDEEVAPQDSRAAVRAAERIVSMNAMLAEEEGEVDGDDAGADLIRQIKRQARIVRGSAYQEQTAKEIVEIQGRFDRWFEARVGISPTRAQDALWKIYQHGNEFIKSNIAAIMGNADGFVEEWTRIKKTRPKVRTEKDNRFLSVLPRREFAWEYGRVQKMAELGWAEYPVSLQSLGFSDDESAGLEQLIGLTAANRADLTDVVHVRNHPLFFLNDKRVLYVDIANAMDALWEAFEKVARADQAFYDGRYQTHKGKWLEEKAAEYLGRVYPAANIFVGLSYPDLARGGGATTELDIAVAWGPFMIFAEAKAKQFRLKGQLGDVGRLRTDIRANVEDAFHQAKRAADYVAATNAPEFVETNSGRRLTIDKQKIKKTFLMTVSLHQLAGLATTLAVFEGLGLFTAGEYPFSLSIADLEFVTEFTVHPDVFLHYIEKRLEIQKLPIRFDADELDFLGAYLDTRFAKPYAWQRNEDDFTLVSLTGYSPAFDDLMLFRRGLIAEKPQIGLSLPEEVKDILQHLRNAGGDDNWQTAFELLGLSHEPLRAIGQLVREMREMDTTMGLVRRHGLQVEDLVIVGTVATGVTIDELVRRSKAITAEERYKRRSAKSVSVAIARRGGEAVFAWIDYTDQAWIHNAELERLVNVARPMRLAASPSKLPGPNEPCFCGKARKFKKCCASNLV